MQSNNVHGLLPQEAETDGVTEAGSRSIAAVYSAFDWRVMLLAFMESAHRGPIAANGFGKPAVLPALSDTEHVSSGPDHTFDRISKGFREQREPTPSRSHTARWSRAMPHSTAPTRTLTPLTAATPLPRDTPRR